jgi:PKD repeat protein
MLRPTSTRTRHLLSSPAGAASVLLLACACGSTEPSPGGGSVPVAAASADREVGPSPLRACFEARASGGADGDASAPSIVWDFGDGSPRAAGPAACHVYAEPGSYAASAEATDGAGGSVLAVVIVTATAP